MDDLERYTRYLPGEPEKPSRRRFKGSRLAVASLVLGFLSLLGMTLPGVGVAIGLAAVVSGCVALARLEGEAGPGPAWGSATPNNLRTPDSSCSFCLPNSPSAAEASRYIRSRAALHSRALCGTEEAETGVSQAAEGEKAACSPRALLKRQRQPSSRYVRERLLPRPYTSAPAQLASTLLSRGLGITALS